MSLVLLCPSLYIISHKWKAVEITHVRIYLLQIPVADQDDSYSEERFCKISPRQLPLSPPPRPSSKHHFNGLPPSYNVEKQEHKFASCLVVPVTSQFGVRLNSGASAPPSPTEPLFYNGLFEKLSHLSRFSNP